MNEVFAYRYLVSKGFDNVRFIKEDNRKRSPDIRYKIHNVLKYCEVKTLGISNDEINRRNAEGVVHDSSVYITLDYGFLNKFCHAIKNAKKQICSFGIDGLVYIIIRFDDIALDNYNNYRKQLIEFSKAHGFENIFVKIGLLGNKRIYIG